MGPWSEFAKTKFGFCLPTFGTQLKYHSLVYDEIIKENPVALFIDFAPAKGKMSNNEIYPRTNGTNN